MTISWKYTNSASGRHGVNADLLTASVNAANAQTAYVQAQSTAQLAVLQLLSDMDIRENG